MMWLRRFHCAAVRPAAESQHGVTGVTFPFSLESLLSHCNVVKLCHLACPFVQIGHVM